MMNYRSSHKLWLAAGPALIAGALACGGDDGRPVYPSFKSSILELASANAELSTWVELVKLSGLDKALGGTQASFTVFAPDNAAFAAVPAAQLEALKADRAALSALLRFHIVAGKRKANLVRLYDQMETITSTTVGVRATEADVALFDAFGGEARVIAVDFEASNGVLHIIDAVLTPPPPPAPPSVVDELGEAGEFSELLGLVDRARLTEALSGKGPFTVFAPSDEAFMAFADLGDLRRDVLANVLLHHVIPGEVKKEALAAAPRTSLAGLPLAISLMGTSTTVGGAPLGERVDVPAGNGIIHQLDGVIVPPTVLEYLTTTSTLSQLAHTATRAIDLLGGALTPDTMSGDRPITVFAPTNEAFAAMGIDPATADPAVLAAVVRRHVVVGQVLASELVDGQVIATLGGSLRVRIEAPGQVELFDAEGNSARIDVRLRDVRTLTGAVHAIDAVLGMPALPRPR